MGVRNNNHARVANFYLYIFYCFRLGVVGQSNSKMVKDCYILPLGATDTIHSSLLPLDGPGLEEVRPNLLLALIVRTRRKRPGDAERDAERRKQQLMKKPKKEMLTSAHEVATIKDALKPMDLLVKGRYMDRQLTIFTRFCGLHLGKGVHFKFTHFV